MEKNIYLYLLVMAAVTYAIRVLPMTLIRRQINSRFIQSFLYYVPYTVLAAMTFPAIFSSTASEVGAVAGCVVAILLAYFKRGLLVVALGAAATVFLAGMF